MAGWDPDKIDAGMKPLVDLATIVGDKNIPRTADVFSDDMTAMGIKAGESLKLASGKVVEGSSYFADAFAYATTTANLNRESLHEGLKYNALPMKQAGFSTGEIFGFNMLAANAGIKGSMAGTAFRAGAIRLQAPAKAGAKALEELGYSATEAQKEMEAARVAMDQLGISADSKAMEKVAALKRKYDENLAAGNKDANAQMLNDIVGKNAYTGWAQILEANNLEQLMKIAAEIDSGAIEGWASDTAKVMRDNTQTSIELLGSSMDALQRSAGQALAPAIRSAAEAITPLVDKVREFVQAHPGFVQGAAAIAAAISAATVAIAGFSLAMAGIRFAQAGFDTAGVIFSDITKKITAMRTAMTGLTAANSANTWSAVFGNIATSAKNAAASVRNFFVTFSASQMLSNAATSIKNVGTAIMTAGRAAMAFAFSPIGVALMALALAGLYVYQNWDQVSSVFAQIAGIITGALGPAITQIQAAINGFTSSGGFAALGQAASSAANVIGGTLVKAFAVLLTIAASTVATIIQLLADLVTVAADIGTGLANAFGKIKEGDFSGAFDSLTSAGSKAFSDLQKLGDHVFDGVEQGAKNVSSVLDAMNQPQITSGGVGAMQAQIAQTSQPEAQPIDTSQTQAALDQVGNAASNAATNMDAVNQSTQQIAQVGNDVQILSTNSQMAAPQIQQLGTQSQTAQTGVQALGTSADGAQSGVLSLGDAAGGAVGNISAMSDAAGMVAGALSSKAAEIGSIHISVPQISVAGAAPATNAQGGIYRKGAFLTTFAETSPEAAIPIDNSARARELWTKTGQMLGLLPGNGGQPSDKGKGTRDKGKVFSLPDSPVTLPPKPAQVPQIRQIPAQTKGIVSGDNVSKDIFDGLLSKVPDLNGLAGGLLSKVPDLNGLAGGLLSKVPDLNGLAGSLLSKVPDLNGLAGGLLSKVPDLNGLAGGLLSKVPDLNGLAGGLLSKVPDLNGLAGGLLSKVPDLNGLAGGLLSKVPDLNGLAGGLLSKIPSLDGLLSQIPTGNGLLGELSGGILPKSDSSPMNFSVTINVNAKNSEKDSIREAVESAIPALDDWAEKFAAHQHEQARRSFA